MLLIARYSIGEALRRRIFVVIVALTAAFLALYALGAVAIFDEVEGEVLAQGALVEDRELTGATLTGIGMFVTFFLGVVLSVFMTMSTVRGDSESGVLQPLAVRPIGRRAVLLGRLAAATAIAAAYVAVVFWAIVLITWLAGDWTPGDILTPALLLAAAVGIVTCLSVLGSVYLPTSANGIAIFMIFGAGLTAGLLNQIGEALDSDSVERIADIAVFVLPFEAMYQGALERLTADASGLTEVAIELGPFGGSQPLSAGMFAWAVAYAIGAVLLALRGFARRDL